MEFVAAKIKGDQVFCKDIRSNRAIDLCDFSRGGLNKAVMKFKLADRNFIDPCFIAGGRPRFANSLL